MKKLLWPIITLSAVIITLFVQGLLAQTSAITDGYSSEEAINLGRVMRPVAGHSAQLTITNTSAATSALVAGQAYSFVCDTTVYWETGDLAAPTADSNSNYLPSDTIIYIVPAIRKSRYVAAVRVRGNGKCYLTQWR